MRDTNVGKIDKDWMKYIQFVLNNVFLRGTDIDEAPGFEKESVY